MNRERCVACFKEFVVHLDLVEHMLMNAHSPHQPRCGICHKHFHTLESVREHLRDANCTTVLSQRGCKLCLGVFSPEDLVKHNCGFSQPPSQPPALSIPLDNAKVVALECLNVDNGYDEGLTKQCASVLLVDLEENVIFSTYVQPRFPVSDYRYAVTGLTEDNLKDGMALEDARDHVISILSGGNVLLVGHDLRHAMSSLGVKHPLPLLRDTALYLPLMKTNRVSHSLKYLTRTYLGYEIQCGGERKLYEDCVSAMRLYKRIRDQEHGEARSRYGLAAFDVRHICAMNPQELYDNSKSNYYCWCNDRRATR